MSMRLKMHTLLALACPLVLAACGDDDNNAATQAGQYQGVYLAADGNPRLATVAINESGQSTLAVLDEEDNSSVSRGTTDGGKISFGSAGDCEINASSLACSLDTLDGSDVPLLSQEPSSAPTVSALAGQYTLLTDGNDEVTIAVAEDGSFTGTLMGCEASGQIEPMDEGGLLTIAVQSGLCDDGGQFGFIESNQLYEASDSLAVYLPGSELSGYWIR